MKTRRAAGLPTLGRLLKSRLVIWGFVTLVAATVGPFSTYLSMSFEMRLVYWGMVAGASMVFGHVLRVIALRVRGRDDVIVDLCVALGMALLFGPGLWLVNAGLVFRTLEWSDMSLPYMIGVVFLISMGVVLSRAYLRELRAGAPDARSRVDSLHADGRAVAPLAAILQPGKTVTLANTDPHVKADPPPRMRAADPLPSGDEGQPAFLRRLEPALGQELVRVSADDHYLRVWTTQGEMRVLMRLRDALGELADLPGFRIHRSHWVARDAVLHVRQAGRRHVAVLRDGTELPVSQSYLPALRLADVPFD